MFCLKRKEPGLSITDQFTNQVRREIRHLRGQLETDPVFAEEVGVPRDLHRAERAQQIISARTRGELLTPEDRSVLREMAQAFRRLKGFGELN